MAAPIEDVLTKHAQVYAKLLAVRASKTVALKPTPMLRKEFVGLDGETRPFTLRYYQVQAVYHLLSMKRMILGDATGVGKTLMLIASLCYAWEREPDNKVIVVTPKSALRQWASEIDKFATGITTYIVDGTLNERKQTYLEFLLHKGDTKAVMLVGYAPLARDWNLDAQPAPLLPNGKLDPKGVPKPGYLAGIVAKIPSLTVTFDEAAAFKSDRTKTWQVCSELSRLANRCYGLTATMLKNNLIEGFAIYKVIYPQVFGNKTWFHKQYCVTQLQKIAGGRKIPIIVGYKNLDGFRKRIDPFYLGRAKHEVSNELPMLTTREVLVEMTAAESAKYQEALSGILNLGDGDVKDYEANKALVALGYCQRTVDSLSLLKYKEGDEIDLDMLHEQGPSMAVGEVGSKEQALLDLLAEEFDNEKVIVYCKYASLIPRLQKLSADRGIQNVAVHGGVVDTKKNPARQKAQQAFQDLKSKVRVIFISDAGSEAINLQAASAMIFYDAPWSWGTYVQLLGRPIRIGSPHDRVTAVHLVAERPAAKAKDRKTIDHYTLAILQKKKMLIDSVLGASAVGALEFGNEGSFTQELANILKARGDK